MFPGEVISALPVPESILSSREGVLKRFISSQIAYPRLLQNFSISGVAHILDHSSAYLVPALKKMGVPILVTAHDIFPLYCNEGLSVRQKNRFRRTLDNLHHADMIFSVSEFSKGDLVEKLGLDAEKILVNPLGVHPCFQPNGPRVTGVAQGRLTVLSVGTTGPRKNLESLPKIFKEVSRTFSNVTLVRIGPKLNEDLLKSLQEILGVEGVIELGRVDEDDLVKWYNTADVLILPSLFEGFGLPALEAMACGCPVVSSHSASLTEVGGDSVTYFDPNDSRGGGEALVKVLGDPALRERMASSGSRRASTFTWEAHCEGLMSSYRKIANS
ncbi:glycosyltransferase family 1 protein [Roseibacillus persicicus]|uniref:glycosyltransferase family 4 protein n=1 Tax=Roseibacillus persicicus TaxID=454148 RepID=UPI00398B6545